MTESNVPQLSVDRGVLVVSVGKDFDSVSVSKIRPQVLQVIDSGSEDIVFDLSETEFIDSSGIGLCVFCYKRLNAKSRRVGMTGLKGQPKSVIGLSQVDRTIQLFDSVEDFIAAGK